MDAQRFYGEYESMILSWRFKGYIVKMWTWMIWPWMWTRSWFDVCLTVYHRYEWSRGPTRCNNKNLLIFKTAQHVSGNSLSILKSVRLWFKHVVYCPQIVVDRRSGVRRMLLEQHPSHKTHSPYRQNPGLRPTTICGHYTTRCKSQSCVPDDGQRIVRNMLSCLEDQ